MDPSIMKFLEEDEDETMHSGADVEAFTAALNRDIEGDNNNNNNNNNNSTSTPQSQPQPPTKTEPSSALSQGPSHTPSQLFQQWQSSKREVKEEEVKPKIQEQKSSAMEVNEQVSGSASQHPPNDTAHDISHTPSEPSRPQDVHTSQAMNMQNTDKIPAQNIEPQLQQRMQRMGNQQAMPTGQAANNAINRPAGKQVPFALLLPVIEPQLDKDRAMQLQGLYARLRNNSINKEEFVRHMRTLVGDHMLKMAVFKLQNGQGPVQPAKHNTQRPSPYVGSSAMHQSSDSSNVPMDANAQKARLMEHQSDSHGVHVNHMSSNVNAIKQDRDQPPFPLQGLGKQQPQHMHYPQSSFPTYGNTVGNYHPGSGPNMNMSSQSLQMRQGPMHPTMGSQPINPMSLPDMKRMHGNGLAHFTSNSQNPGHWQQSAHKDSSLMSSMPYAKPDHADQMNDQQHKSQMSTPQGQSSFSQGQLDQGGGVSGSSKDETSDMSSRTGFSASMSKPVPMSITAQLEHQNAMQAAGNPSLVPGSNAKTPPKKPTVGQKKPSEAPVSSISKKQKVSGAYSDQSIEQLNDVTAVSGVNLKEEEEQLFSGSKEDSRVSEASRKVVQEEEERLILQKTPLQKKLIEIMAKCGVKNSSNDVERCLSLCVEERMRGLISNLIRLSKHRVDIEKPRHRTVITSDVRQQIMSMNQKAREEWERKQADAEKLQRADEPEGSGDGEDGRGKLFKVNKEEDDKMRTTAANVAARAAVGGDDMLSKWQLMAEQARQKREGGPETASTSQPSIDVGPKPVPNSERNSKDNSDTERSSGVATATPGPVRKLSRHQDLVQSGSSSIARTITVKDVIAVLGREVQMSRSTLIYRLYEKVRSYSASES